MPFLMPLLKSGGCKSLLVSFGKNNKVVSTLIPRGTGM